MSDNNSDKESYSLKLRAFWKPNLLVWFIQVEAQFCTKGITLQKTKFDYVVAAIDAEIANEVIDIITQKGHH